MADPHPTCLKHNTTCFRQYEYTPEGCIHCTYLIKRYKEGQKEQQAVFLARIDAMQHKIGYLARSNPEKLPEQVKTRFLAGDKNPFALHLRHLDPRPRTARSLTASVALLPTLPTPTPKNPPGQSRTPSLQRSLKLVSSYSRIAQTTLPSRALELAEPLRTTRPTVTPHNTTDLTTAGTNGNVPGPPPQNLLERWHAGLHLLGPTAARDPVGLGHEHPAGPNRRILAEGAPTDPPAGIRCAP